MNNFLSILEKAWLFAVFCAIATAIYFAFTERTFSYHIYFPLICAGFCFLIYRNIRGQRKFIDKHKNP
ncbi:MAG TPA: hypothetical protein VGB95_01430 [Chitinophagales bacterium]